MDNQINSNLEIATARFNSGWRPQKLLADNTKLAKAEKFGFVNLGLSLAPAKSSGFQICASASPECIKHCIFTSGRGIFDKTQVGRLFRTLWFFKDRQSFMTKLYWEIHRNQGAVIRLNVFSDWMWERQSFEIAGVGRFANLMEAFPETQFMDYTKHFNRMFRPRPQNYHLTFSLHETNGHQAQEVLQAGMNVAAVTNSYEGYLFGYPVINGDDHDLRFLDPEPCVVGLKAKGSLKSANEGGMVYETAPATEFEAA